MDSSRIYNGSIDDTIIDEVVILFYEVDLIIKHLLEHLSADFYLFNSQFKNGYKELTELRLQLELNAEVGFKVNECFTLLQVVHSNLQYQDTLEQKLRHIKHVHDTLAAELLSNIKINKSGLKRDRLKIIQKIAELSFAQLKSVEKEFIDAFQNSINHFNGLARELKSVLNYLCKNESLETPKTNVPLNLFSLEEKVKSLIVVIEQFIDKHQDSKRFTSTLDKALQLLQSFSSDLIIDLGWQPSDALLLKEIEKTYTMESQRIVFRGLVNKNQEQGLLNEVESSDNIDLF